MENYIQDYSYENCFWDNVDFLYDHSKSKFNEYLNIGKLNYNLAQSLINFSNSLNEAKNDFIPYKKNDTSSRGKGIQVFINLISNIISNLKNFANNLIDIFKKIEEKRTSYESKDKVKKLCKENFEIYQKNFKSISNKKNSYYESINQAIEQYLNDKKKYGKKNSQETINKIEYCKKKKNEYKDKLLETENNRIEYIELQRNIMSSEEEFERDCTNELKYYLKQVISFYNDFLKKGVANEEMLDVIEKMDGIRDNQVFAEENRTIFSCPPRIEFIEYNQNLGIYLNFEVIKNKLKNKTKEEIKEEKIKISSVVKKFLNTNIIITENNKYEEKFDEIADNILNKELKEEDFNYLINVFQKTYDDFQKWGRENQIEILEFKKVGEVWDNRFSTMQMFLDSFNKVRGLNKELKPKNFEYFTKAMDKILTLNNNKNIDYKLCELLLTLSATFYMTEKIEDKEVKKFANEYIRKNPLIQEVWFWVGLTKYELYKETIKEKENDKDEDKEKNNIFPKTIFGNLNLNINFNYFNINFKKFPKIPFLTKKKKTEDKGNIENKKKELQIKDKNIVAQLMTISFNILQFILDSDTLNLTLANIFRNFKISQENKQTIIAMMNFHIESEKINHLKINEEMLLNCDKVDYFANSKENKNKEENDKNDFINVIKEDNQNNNN